MSRGIRTAALAIGIMALAASGSRAEAQVQLPDDGSDYVEQQVPIGEGLSSYAVADERVNVFHVRPAITLRSWMTNPWGLRLRLGLTISIVDFERLESLDLDKVSLGSLVPGVEAVFPVGRLSVLRPYFDFGLGGIFDSEQRPAPILGVGLLTEFVFPWKQFELGLEPRVEYLTVFSESTRDDDDFGTFVLLADARHPLWFQMGRSQPDVGLYFRYTYLWEEQVFASPFGAESVIEQLFEVGAIFGFQARPKVWIIRIPTIGFGYRFGSLKGFTIRIGGDRIVRLAEPLR